MDYFIYLWKNNTWDKKQEQAKDGYCDLDYAASNKFTAAGVRSGATVFIVTNKQGELYLGGYIQVHDVLDKARAAAYLGQNENDLWDAEEYIVARKDRIIEFRDDLEVPLAKAMSLELKDGKGFKNPKPDKETGKLDRQTFRNIRQLYPGSERTLLELLAV